MLLDDGEEDVRGDRLHEHGVHVGRLLPRCGEDDHFHKRESNLQAAGKRREINAELRAVEENEWNRRVFEVRHRVLGLRNAFDCDAMTCQQTAVTVGGANEKNLVVGIEHCTESSQARMAGLSHQTQDS